MRYTDEPPPPFAGVGYANAVVVFSVKVTELSDGLEWPLDVYGVVAARDSADHNRKFATSSSTAPETTARHSPHRHAIYANDRSLLIRYSVRIFVGDS